MGTKSFQELTTFKIGGAIKHYFEVSSDDEVIKAIAFAKENKLPVFIIGDGSDILVSDKDFDGVVIRHTAKSFSFSGDECTAEAGMNWDDLVSEAAKRDLQGIECLSGIPGTVGAAPIQNIGAYGQEIKDTFISLRAYDIENEKFVSFTNEDCQFDYRDSFFKRNENWQKYIITSITLKLNSGEKSNIKYESLKSYITTENPTLLEVRNAVLAVRKDKLVSVSEVPNAGSFFKNPIINMSKKTELEEKFNDIKIYPFKNEYKVSAGYMIEKAGWRGKVVGNIKVSDKHALVITNPDGKGSFEEVVNVASSITADVENMFGIKLEPEVQYINYGL